MPLDPAASERSSAPTPCSPRIPALAQRQHLHAAAILGDDDDGSPVCWRSIRPARPPTGGRAAGTRSRLPLFLALPPARSARGRTASSRAATALLDAGAIPNPAGRTSRPAESPNGRARSTAPPASRTTPELTRLLLERGADPNDDETPYHAPETYDNAALKVLVESGKLTDDSLVDDPAAQDRLARLRRDQVAARARRRAGRHRPTGAKRRCTTPSSATTTSRSSSSCSITARIRWRSRPVRSAARRGPGIGPRSQMAARRGRGDVLDAFARRGVLDRARGPRAAAGRVRPARCRGRRSRSPRATRRSSASCGPTAAGSSRRSPASATRTACAFCSIWASPSMRRSSRAKVTSTSRRTAWRIHVAAWRASHATVRLLIERGSPIDTPDGKGRTPLMLAVRACVDSYWTRRRTPESVKALLDAGASVHGVQFPSGYADGRRAAQRSTRPDVGARRQLVHERFVRFATAASSRAWISAPLAHPLQPGTRGASRIRCRWHPSGSPAVASVNRYSRASSHELHS